jgi:phosphotransferase system enzyme I (PtsI)
VQILPGIAVSPGVAIGEALVIDNEGFRIPRRFVARDADDSELERLAQAIAAVETQVGRDRDTITTRLGSQYGAIFSAHLTLLSDPKLRDELEQMVRERHYSPEYAVSRTLRRYAKAFESLDNAYLAERAVDLFDIERHLLRNLTGLRRSELSQLVSPAIVLAHTLTPSETANLDRRFVLGFATETGGAGSHTAIVAQGLEIPALVGIGPFLSDIGGGDMVIVDGDHGQIIVQPDDATLEH